MTSDAAGNLYASDFMNHVIVEVTPAGMLSIVAGNGTTGSPVPGPALSSPLPVLIRAMAADASGAVYFQNAMDATIWRISAGALSQVAGNGTNGPGVPGPALASPLGSAQHAFAVTADGTIIIGDAAYGYLYAISPGGTLSVIAGDGSFDAATPGPASASSVGIPVSVAVDAAGDIYVADAANYRVYRIDAGGTISWLAFDGTIGPPVAGDPLLSPYSPFHLATDSAGTLYVGSAAQVVRIGSAEPSAPRGLAATPAGAAASLTFDAPVTPGTTAITGYEVSLDAGATWTPLTTTAGAGAARTATLAGLDASRAYTVQVRALNGSGPGAAATVQLPATVAPAVDAAAPVAAAGAAPSAPTAPAPPAGRKPFLVAVRFRLPKACGRGCVLTTATLRTRDGKTVLGTRRNVRVAKGGLIAFTIPVDKAALLAAGDTTAKPGRLTARTRFAVTARLASGGRWSRVKQGRLAVAIARLASGRAPALAVSA
jgi:titin